MAYKFNGGQGAVICDKCRLMIDRDISYQEYLQVYNTNNNGGDFCTRCKRPEDFKNGKEFYKLKEIS